LVGSAASSIFLFLHTALDLPDGVLELLREFLALLLLVLRKLLALVLPTSVSPMCVYTSAAAAPYIYLDALVFFLQFPTQRFQLVLHTDGFLHLRSGLIFFLLQLIRAFPRLCMIPLKAFHLVQEFAILGLDRVDFG
jgi:hypothetical protein